MFAYRRSLVRRRVIVNLDSGTTFSGIAWAQRGPLLVLRNVETSNAGRSVPVDGEVIVERRRIDYIQVLTDPTGRGV